MFAGIREGWADFEGLKLKLGAEEGFNDTEGLKLGADEGVDDGTVEGAKLGRDDSVGLSVGLGWSGTKYPPPQKQHSPHGVSPSSLVKSTSVLESRRDSHPCSTLSGMYQKQSRPRASTKFPD